MRATISKIHPIKYSRNGNAFIRVEFRTEDGIWAKTDLCPTYRNFARWKPYLVKGTVLDGLVMPKTGFIDADSYPTPFNIPETEIVVEDLPDYGGEQLKMI